MSRASHSVDSSKGQWSLTREHDEQSRGRNFLARTRRRAGAGLVGVSAPQIATAVGVGIGNAYSATGQYIGTSTGAIGADISKVVFANPATLTPLLVSSLAVQGVVGPAAVQLCAGLAPGIASMFLTGFGTGVAAGPTGPSPGTGVSKSSVL